MHFITNLQACKKLITDEMRDTDLDGLVVRPLVMSRWRVICVHHRLYWGLADHGHTNLDLLYVLDWLQLNWANLPDLQLLNMLHGLSLHHLSEVKVKNVPINVQANSLFTNTCIGAACTVCCTGLAMTATCW